MTPPTPYPPVVQQLLQGLESPQVPCAPPLTLYRLERVQLVPRSVEEVFAFFAEVQNLETITPPFLRFRILTSLPVHLVPGSVLDYRLQLFHLPLHWRTRIELYQPPWCFTDVQLAGPYRYWHHVHVFVPMPGGTLALDRVDYALPYGWLGRLTHAVCVRRLLERIFDYRRQQLCRLLSAPPA